MSITKKGNGFFVGLILLAVIAFTLGFRSGIATATGIQQSFAITVPQGVSEAAQGDLLPVQQLTDPTGTAIPYERVEAIDAYFGDLGPQKLAEAYEIVNCESSFRPDAHRTDVGRLGSGDHGLFQINGVHEQLISSFGYSWSDMFVPQLNARVARSIYDTDVEQGGSGWGPWYISRSCHGIS